MMKKPMRLPIKPAAHEIASATATRGLDASGRRLIKNTLAAGMPTVQTKASNCGQMMTAAKAPLPEGPKVLAVRIPVQIFKA